MSWPEPEEDDEEDYRTVLEWLEDEVVPQIEPYAQDRFPVIVAYTEYKVAWIEGENREDALKRIQQDGDWYERISKSDPAIDYDVSFDHPDPYQWADSYFGNAVYTDEHGPLWACPHCGHRGMKASSVIHKPECPDRPKR